MKQTITSAYTYAKKTLNQGHARSIKAKQNIFASFLIRGGSIAVSLILVPLTINYVNPTSYGIWLTLSSIVSWFTFFDIGFGHGLRNKFAEAVANKNYRLAKKYVSTTYAILTIIIFSVLILFYLVNPLLHWDKILNAPAEMAAELSLLALVVFSFFAIQFVLKLIATVLTANQEPAKANFWIFLGSVLSLIIIYVLTKTTSGNLVYLGLGLSFAPALVLLLSTIYYYKNEYRRFSPAFKYVDFKLSKDLLGLGGKFFIIQIGVIILLSTNNIIITQLFGPAEVTPFNIAYKLFSVVTMGFGIIVSPLWSAYTEAYIKGEMDWIRNILRKMNRIWLLCVLGCILVTICSPFLYRFWIGESVHISMTLSVGMALFVIAYIWHQIYVFFLNGTGIIQLQLYLVIVTSLINIPLAMYLGGKLGLVGISLASAILYTIMGTAYYIQTQKILNGTATGIWKQ